MIFPLVAALPPALDLLVEDWDDAGTVDADVLPGGLRHVEVVAGRIAPPAVVAGKIPVGRAEVGGGHGDGRAGLAHLRLAGVAGDEVALSARRAVVEQRRAQRHVVDPVPRIVQVLVPTCAACTLHMQNSTVRHAPTRIALRTR